MAKFGYLLDKKKLNVSVMRSIFCLKILHMASISTPNHTRLAASMVHVDYTPVVTCYCIMAFPDSDNK